MALLLFALALPSAALASGKDVIRDCAQDGDLDKDYSDEELEDAYGNLPSDIDEYSDCRDVIEQAQGGGSGSSQGGTDDSSGSAGGTSSGSGGGSSGEDTNGSGNQGTASDQQELANRADSARNGDQPPVTAASGGAGDSDSGLPTAALVAIILLILAAIAGGLYMMRDRLPAGLTSRVPGLRPGQGR